MNETKSILPHQPSHLFTLLLVTIILFLLALIAAKEITTPEKPLTPPPVESFTVDNPETTPRP